MSYEPYWLSCSHSSKISGFRYCTIAAAAGCVCCSFIHFFIFAKSIQRVKTEPRRRSAHCTLCAIYTRITTYHIGRCLFLLPVDLPREPSSWFSVPIRHDETTRWALATPRQSSRADVASSRNIIVIIIL